MSLSTEERKQIVCYRLEKAQTAFTMHKEMPLWDIGK